MVYVTTIMAGVWDMEQALSDLVGVSWPRRHKPYQFLSEIAAPKLIVPHPYFRLMYIC